MATLLPLFRNTRHISDKELSKARRSSPQGPLRACTSAWPAWPSLASKARQPQFRRRLLAVLAVVLLVLLLNRRRINTLRRDLGYVLRPIWDSPEKPFDVVTHWPRPAEGGKDQWCALHGWRPRSGNDRPLVVDAIPISTELDMLEIRMREYAPYVGLFVIVEANMTFAGTPKPTHFANARARFDAIAEETGSAIVYRHVGDFVPNLPPGSFDNEVKQRRAISGAIQQLRDDGAVPGGSLLLQSDVDEIISRSALDLLTSCEVPDNLHLSVRNYRYSFDQPIRDAGYWRPRVVDVPDFPTDPIHYHHGRAGDTLLADAGWHCSFCFPTLDDMRAKMLGYSHNDRAQGHGLLDEKSLRRRVCNGEDPFAMWPEAFTFRDLVAQSGGIRRERSFLDVPIALQDEPRRFGYLLDKGCDRPDSAPTPPTPAAVRL